MSNIGDQEMKKSGRLLGTVGAAALAVLIADPALASGTQAGSTITNNVTVSFQVGGVAQTAEAAANTFTVDRKITMTVADADGATTTVSPGESNMVTKFTVTNSSNAVLDFGLAVAQQTGGSGAHSNTDSFDATNLRIYVDNGDGVFNSSTDTLVSYIDELAADASKTVFVVSDIPLSLATGSVAAVTLTATAREGGTSGSQGNVVTQTSGANTAGMDTVFADAAGATDQQYDGKYSAKDDYTVFAAALSVTKTSTVISDPVNGTSNPKAIPGATVEYCIIVSNAAGSATATGVTVSDPLPATVTYVAGSTYLNGSATSGVCNADGSLGGTFSAGTVSGTLSNIAANDTKTLRFRATIN